MPNAYEAFPDLAEAIESYFRPNIFCLLGVPPHTPASQVIPPPGEPCWLCGAVRDRAGKVIAIEARDPLTREPIIDPDTGRPRLIQTGIREGDQLACGACTCLSPSRERRAKTHGKPVRAKDKVKPAGPPKLTAKDRRSLGRKPSGFCWVAMNDAEQAGDATLAARLQTLLYRLQDRQIDEAALGTILGEMFPGSPWAEKFAA